MLYFGRTVFSIDVIKTSTRNALLVTIGTFLGKIFGFQPTVCKECHVSMLSFDINNITALKM